MWQEQGFHEQAASGTKSAVLQLKEMMELVASRYPQYSAEELLGSPAPGKWSKQQVLGHLIDSAINNLKRFTEIQFSEQPYLVLAYAQDELMAVNHYQDLPLYHLIQLYLSLNQQIIYVIKQVPADKLYYHVIPQYSQTGTK
ncbi:MAG: hypothetical protein RLZZ28_1691, partial [Bacteroidota bacterium]